MNDGKITKTENSISEFYFLLCAFLLCGPVFVNFSDNGYWIYIVSILSWLPIVVNYFALLGKKKEVGTVKSQKIKTVLAIINSFLLMCPLYLADVSFLNVKGIDDILDLEFLVSLIPVLLIIIIVALYLFCFKINRLGHNRTLIVFLSMLLTMFAVWSIKVMLL